MAASLFALLDDIAALLDDVAVMTKVATKKTAGVLGDDLALNAEQVTGVDPTRELPVVWAVAKGSALNKVILVPAALVISAVAPWIILPLLMLGGAFLCFEGVEKLVHKFLHKKEAEEERAKISEAAADASIDLVQLEKDKIKGAIRTDFILSAEIIVITLGAVAGATFGVRVGVLITTAVMITVLVYGLVAGLVKLDDIGLRLDTPGRGAAARALGRGLVKGTPYLMRLLSFVGTAAMFLVGGGIVMHGVAPIETWVKGLEKSVEGVPGAATILGTLAAGLLGLLVGIACLAVVEGVKRVLKKR
jgi:predicted DNA repair protein MutK